MNEVKLVGRVGKDPELKAVGDKNTSLVMMSIATSKNVGTYDKPNWVSSWHNIKAWGRVADKIAREVVKGDEVFVTGELTQEQGEKDGVKQYRTFVTIDSCKVFMQFAKAEPAPQTNNNSRGSQRSNVQQQSPDASQW